MDQNQKGPTPEQMIQALKVRCFDLNEEVEYLKNSLDSASKGINDIAVALAIDVEAGVSIATILEAVNKCDGGEDDNGDDS